VLQVTKQLAAAAWQGAVPAHLPVNMMPLAMVDLVFDAEGEQAVHITLQGAIAGASVVALSEFLQDISKLTGSRWVLHLQGTAVLSSAALRKLARLAKGLRARGYALEVRAASTTLRSSFQELGLMQYFEWPEPGAAPANFQQEFESLKPCVVGMPEEAYLLAFTEARSSW